ncbi:cation transporter [Alicyclobacillus sp. SO9]|nr:cation transporter [Alicyclobacillus sp. SO9]
MIVEAAVGVLAGLLAHSLALTAFGLDSVIEVISGIVLLWRLYVELNGGSKERVERAERRASAIVGGLLLLLAVYILIASLFKLFHHQSADTSWLGLGLAVVSAIWMPILSKSKVRIGAQIGSAALRADGGCSMVCAYMAWVLLGGVALTALFGWWWIDSIAALGLIYFVVSEGWEAIQEARGIEDDDDD